MGYSWDYLDDAGHLMTDVPGIGSVGRFPTQADAEAYATESWAELAGAGVASVTLRRDGTVVYGPMSLAAE